MEQNPLPNPVLPTNPVVQQPVTPQPGHSNKKRIILMIVFLALAVAMIAGSAVAYKKSQDDKELTQAAVVAKQKVANDPVKLLSAYYVRDKKSTVTSFNVKLTNLDGSEIASKIYSESRGDIKPNVDGSAAIIISKDKSGKEIYRLINKAGTIKEVYTYSPPAQSSQDSSPDSEFVGFVGSTNDFILRQKYDDYNAAIVRVSESGTATTLLKEDRNTYLDPGNVTPDGNKYTYQKVSAKGSSCGGDEASAGFKVPDWSGAILELRMLDLNSKTDEILIKDSRKPPLGTNDIVKTGLYLDSFSSDSKKAFMTRSAGGCSGGGRPMTVYAVDLLTKQTTTIGSEPGFADDGITTKSGIYRVYIGPYFTQADLTTDKPDETKVEIVNLETSKQKEVNIPAPFKNSDENYVSSYGTVTIDGKEKVILIWHITENKKDNETLGILDVSSGTFETMPISFAKDPSLSRVSDGTYCSRETFVNSGKLYIWQGCSFDVVDLKTKNITKKSADGQNPVLLR